MSANVEPLPGLIEESLEEATFLWSRWESDLSSISRNLDEVWSWTEDRLSGALDGVQLAPAAILERLMGAALTGGNLSELTVCGHVLACAKAENARALLGQALRDAKGAQLLALIRGVEVANLDGSFAPLAKILLRQGPEHAAALARLKAFRRASLGEELKVAFESGIPALQIEAQHAARALPQQYAAGWVETGLNHAVGEVRLAAMESGVRSRIPNAWGAALATARQLRREAAGLLRLIAMLGSDAEHQIVFGALAKPTLQHSAIWALGHIGTREAAEHCLLAMKHPKLAKAAGEAYCAITGADMLRDKLIKAEPDAPTPEFEADDLDANLVPTAEDQWPLPNLEAVQEHWSARAARFVSGGRYLRGRPVNLEVLMRAVEHGPMLRRPDYAFELYVRTEGKYDLEARTTRQVQRRMMAAGRSRATAHETIQAAG